MTNEGVRARILDWWTKLGKEALTAHCGGQGLAVGCPVCKKRWGKK